MRPASSSERSLMSAPVGRPSSSSSVVVPLYSRQLNVVEAADGDCASATDPRRRKDSGANCILVRRGRSFDDAPLEAVALDAALECLARVAAVARGCLGVAESACC